jgi:hypothetical protein
MKVHCNRCGVLTEPALVEGVEKYVCPDCWRLYYGSEGGPVAIEAAMGVAIAIACGVALVVYWPLIIGLVLEILSPRPALFP